MSMRATFTTSFIYDSSEGHEDRQKKIMEILSIDLPIKNYIGQLYGITKGLDLSEHDIRMEIEEIGYALSKVTIVPFMVVWVFESYDVLVKRIEP